MKVKLKTNFFWTIVAALLIAEASIFAMAGEDVVKKLEAKYNTAKTYSAAFDQVVESKTYHSVVARGKGKVFFKSPGKMRWEYNEPEKHIVVMDGEFMWDYYEE